MSGAAGGSNAEGPVERMVAEDPVPRTAAGAAHWPAR